MIFVAQEKGKTMDDLISRQAAIDAIDRLDIPEDMCVFEILSHIELEIGNLPSAQPEILACGEGELNVPDTNVGDTISRRAAIDALENTKEVTRWI